MSLRKQIVLVMLGLVVLAGALRLASAKPSGSGEVIASPLVKKIQSALSLVDQFYIQDPKPQSVIDGALKGLAAGLDEASEYLTPLEYEQLSIEAKGDYVGIGIILGEKDGFWTFREIVKDSPAERAGLRADDRLLAVNGKSATSLSLDGVVRLLEGPAGSSVKLLVSSSGVKGEIELIREKILMETLRKTYVMPERVGYIRCLDFSDKTAPGILQAVRKMELEDIRGLALDLRGNAGGIFDAAIDTAKLFLKKDQAIVSTRGRVPEDDQVYRAAEDGPLADLSLVILVDRMTASAAEILSGALQENKRAVLVGEKTYGKASIQSVFPLEDGSALRLTTAFYHTPSGKLIQKNGIEPDIKIAALSGTGHQNDQPLERALEVLTR